MSHRQKHIISFVEEFCAHPRPSMALKNQLNVLISENFHRFENQMLVKICALLSHSSHTPKPLIKMFCKLPIDICRTMLSSINRLDTDEIVEIIDNHAIDYARIIARCPNINEAIHNKLLSLNDAQIERSLNLRQRPEPIKALHFEPSQIVETSLADSPKLSFMATLYAETELPIIQTAIADKIGLSLTSVELICSDRTSKNMPCLLRALSDDENIAWSIYAKFSGAFANRHGVETAFRKSFKSLPKNEAQSIVDQWRMDELIMNVRYGEAANDTDGKAIKIAKTA